MYGIHKSYGQKQVLKNINLSFYPGAKIGIVGEKRFGQNDPATHYGRSGNRFSGARR